jgi:hypothetical protein
MNRPRLLHISGVALLALAFSAPAQANASTGHDSGQPGLATVRVPATGVFHCVDGTDYTASAGQLVVRQRDVTDRHGRDVLVLVDTSHVTATDPEGRVYTISGGVIDAVHYTRANAAAGTSPETEFFASMFTITSPRGDVVGRVNVRYSLRPDGTSSLSDAGTCSAPSDAG